MKRVKELETLIKQHKALYYAGTPEISDFEFDKLEEELKSIAPDNPILSLVGNELVSHEKVKHDSKMLSLGKTYAVDELIKWAEGKEVLAIYKVDGVSCSLVYDQGVLELAKTRGDGQYGENITNKVKWMTGIPQTIQTKQRIEIRGEIYCDESQFIKLSNTMVENGMDKPSSQRNIVAGLVGRKENIDLCRFLNFKAFDVIGLEYKKETEKYDFLISSHFESLEYKLPKNKEEYNQLIDEAKSFMSEGDYLIDGLVFVYNEISLHNELGETAHHPRYKMAFKFQGETKVTTINSITWQVSRNGYLTPVGEVEPIDISGAKISRVTLHNFGMVKQYNLKCGDQIEIVRSGEVIPKFLQVIKESETKFLVPSECPSCNESVVEEDIRLVCKNDECPAQVKENILNFIQKIGIDDLSSKRLDEMLRVKMVTTIEDIYKLSMESLLELDKVKEKLATKLIESINKSKSADLVTFLSALGISGGAYNKCEKVVTAGFDSIDKLFSMTAEELAHTEGFAEKSANDFINSLKSKKDIVDSLIQRGFSFEKIEQSDLALSGLKICITGSLSEKRSNVESKIRQLGGAVVGSVSKNTNILLTNETEAKSSKYKKALDLGIDIINEEKLNSLIDG